MPINQYYQYNLIHNFLATNNSIFAENTNNVISLYASIPLQLYNWTITNFPKNWALINYDLVIQDNYIRNTKLFTAVS